MRLVRGILIVALVLMVSVPICGAQEGDWRHFGSDAANTKYSALDEIDRDNFGDLEIAWRWASIEGRVEAENRRVQAGQFKVTPLVVDGMVYVVTAVNQLAGIDAATGETVWEYDPESYKAGRPANIGWQHRGVSFWSDNGKGRIVCATQDRKLILLDAKTGELIPDFGENGVVDLATSLGKRINPRTITHTSPPGIYKDTIIVGSIVFDRPIIKEGTPGHVRGFDARTGELKWIFHTVPMPGEIGHDTWEEGSAAYSGAANVWSMFAVDEELGYVYLPVGTSTNDFYGGQRKGDNLFAESIVCLNAETGERVWHFQAIHHGLWDYDFPTAGNLADVVVDGKKIPVIAQVSKQAFAYVLDRRTGKPVWPIEERAVPASTVPGERASETQPFPTKPLAYDQQGITVDDLIDFTPELRAKALEAIQNFEIGPLYTPPIVSGEKRGIIQIPGDGGGTNWPGAALDPETGILYVPSSTSPGGRALAAPDPARSNFNFVAATANSGAPRIEGLKIVKPPWARITAIDLNTGEHVWMTPNGWGPVDHPALKDLNLGPLGQSSGGPLVTKTLLFVNQRGGIDEKNSPRINVYDKATGEWLGHIPLPESPHGNPITFSVDGRQHIAVAVGGGPYFTGMDHIRLEETTMSAEQLASMQARRSRGSTAKAELIVFRLP